jgi:hypothetical protein
MTGAHPKPIAARTSRRSLLQGLGAAAVGITLLNKLRPAWAAEEPKLNFYNWDTYIGETTLDDFAEASGIDVNMSLFATNDELFAKLRAGNPGYDVIVPGSEFVERMIQANLLEPLDHAKIPNIKNISPEFMENAPFDPGRKLACLTPGWSSASAIASRRSTRCRIAGSGCSIPTPIRAASRSCRMRASCSAIASNISANL